MIKETEYYMHNSSISKFLNSPKRDLYHCRYSVFTASDTSRVRPKQLAGQTINKATRDVNVLAQFTQKYDKIYHVY